MACWRISLPSSMAHPRAPRQVWRSTKRIRISVAKPGWPKPMLRAPHQPVVFLHCMPGSERYPCGKAILLNQLAERWTQPPPQPEITLLQPRQHRLALQNLPTPQQQPVPLPVRQEQAVQQQPLQLHQPLHQQQQQQQAPEQQALQLQQPFQQAAVQPVPILPTTDPEVSTERPSSKPRTLQEFEEQTFLQLKKKKSGRSQSEGQSQGYCQAQGHSQGNGQDPSDRQGQAGAQGPERGGGSTTQAEAPDLWLPQLSGQPKWVRPMPGCQLHWHDQGARHTGPIGPGEPWATAWRVGGLSNWLF